ncbi:hypothetical protein MUK42_34613 [Musa troglodytarum]|uniref:Uncharacterized protein n=1 Tax=Musa troglodytarum TaxID=320322 RepID=A0A9E7JU15_9LILI|nr:hypothetical protein MUK42_34613 [Musa troglodytarum]
MVLFRNLQSIQHQMSVALYRDPWVTPSRWLVLCLSTAR